MIAKTSHWVINKHYDIPQDLKDFIKIEEAALHAWSIHPSLIVGLLQTRGYMRATLKMFWDKMAGYAEVDEEIRLERQKRILSRDSPLKTCQIIIPEEVLRRTVGGNEVMIEQVESIAALAQNDRRFTILIVPLERGEYPTMEAPIAVYQTSDTTYAYREGYRFNGLNDDKETVASAKKKISRCAELALSPQKSLEFMRQIAADLRRAV